MSYERLAEKYDEFMYDEPASKWFSYIWPLCGTPKRVIEYACGTGRITEQLLRAGLDVIAVDSSVEMLNVASRKLRSIGGRLQLVEADMCGFHIDHCADLALCTCDGVNYVTERSDLIRFFRNVHDNLRSGGLFVFDLSTAYKLETVLGDEFFYDDEEDATLFWQNRFYPETRLSEMNLTVFQKTGRQYERFDEIHVQRAWTVSEITQELMKAGFADIRVYGFETNAPPCPDTERIQFVAQKPPVCDNRQSEKGDPNERRTASRNG